jgi:hypothetical protein
MRIFGNQCPLTTVAPVCRSKAGNCIVANKLISFSAKQYELAPLISKTETRPAPVARGHEKKHLANRAWSYANATA